MKLKYYLRGAGVGILITTLIFTIASALISSKPSREEIIAEAQKLGMVMPEDQKKDQQTEDQKKDDQPKDDQQTDDRQSDVQDPQTPSEPSFVTFSIAVGEHSATVIQRLYDMGLIDNMETYNDYLEANNYDSFLQPGEFSVPEGCSYEELTRILMTKQENRGQ